MATTTVASNSYTTSSNSANSVQQWNKDFWREWQRGNKFDKYTGKTANAIIQRIEDLVGKPGVYVTQSLVTRLSNSPTTGDNTLHGSEEAIGNYAQQHMVNQFRHAVLMGHYEQAKTHIDMLKAARPLLQDWRVAYHRDEIIAAMLIMNTDGATRYASTSEANKDTAFAANSDRVLMGGLISNYSGDHSADLAKITASTHDFDPEALSVMKRMAKLSDPHIRPVNDMKGDMGEFYVGFAPSYTFRDFKTSASQLAAHQYASARGKGNPLFNDNTLFWDGVALEEIPEISVLSGVGASSINVGLVALCGAQAISYAVGERTNSKMDDWDYQNQKGVSIGEISVVNLTVFNSVFHGMVKGYFPCVADS